MSNFLKYGKDRWFDADKISHAKMSEDGGLTIYMDRPGSDIYLGDTEMRDAVLAIIASGPNQGNARHMLAQALSWIENSSEPAPSLCGDIRKELGMPAKAIMPNGNDPHSTEWNGDPANPERDDGTLSGFITRLRAEYNRNPTQ